VPDHEDTAGNKMADQLAKLGSEHLFIGPELARGISMGVVKNVVMDWIIRDHKKHWDSLSGQKKKEKTLIQGPTAKETRELLKLNRDQLQWVLGLLIGQSPKRTPFQTGIGK
jgi:hypothetical protein